MRANLESHKTPSLKRSTKSCGPQDPYFTNVNNIFIVYTNFVWVISPVYVKLDSILFSWLPKTTKIVESTQISILICSHIK